MVMRRGRTSLAWSTGQAAFGDSVVSVATLALWHSVIESVGAPMLMMTTRTVQNVAPETEAKTETETDNDNDHDDSWVRLRVKFVVRSIQMVFRFGPRS